MHFQRRRKTLQSPDPARAARAIQRVSGRENHDLAIVLGSGWADSVATIGRRYVDIPVSRVPGFGNSQIPGHLGKLGSLETTDGKRVLIVGARKHLYEGLGVRAVTHPITTAAACGASTIVITNAAGGIPKSWSPGQLVLISDQINLSGVSPLRGATFLDLTDLYSRRLRNIAKRADPTLEEGVYVQFRGPQYETPAEVQMAKSMGGHIVGMSTAIEAIAAKEAGMEVLGLSLITNLAAGISPHPLSHQEVIDAGRAAKPRISELLANIVNML